VEYRFGEITVACTHIDRVMFPADGITKGEVIAYYHDIAGAMMPELIGRPLSVVRYPKGVLERRPSDAATSSSGGRSRDNGAGGFFQKHFQKHFPAWLDHVIAGKTAVDYPIVDTPAGLVYLANQGSIEFHVWTSRKDAVDRPDVLVFDLDPPDGRFDLVRRTALLLRELLTQLDLPAFVKTTGSKGLHVVVPLDDTAAFDEVGALGTRIGALLCRRHPDILTMELYKKDRKGRLFMDITRNASGATVIAPYSLRGRPGAPLSAPLAWSEVDDPALGPDGIQLRAARARLDRRGDPWHDLRKAPGSVAGAMRSLDQLDPEPRGPRTDAPASSPGSR
jgi:bifunctional non-homologous end joining protein LigD